MLDCQLLICAAANDLPWLNASLRSVKKYWKGSVSPIVVLTPECRNRLPSILTEMQAYVVFQPLDRHDYIRMTADSYLSAPMVLFMDVHELFIRECSLGTFTGGSNKPLVTVERYSSELFRPDADIHCVQARRWTIDEVLGILPEFEFTSREPMLFYRSSIRKLRETIEEKNKRPLKILMQNVLPEYFSSFNFMAEYCHDREEAAYEWVDSTAPYQSSTRHFRGITDCTRGEDLEAVQSILFDN